MRSHKENEFTLEQLEQAVDAEVIIINWIVKIILWLLVGGFLGWLGVYTPTTFIGLAVIGIVVFLIAVYTTYLRNELLRKQ